MSREFNQTAHYLLDPLNLLDSLNQLNPLNNTRKMEEKELKESLEIFAHKIRNPIHSVALNLDVLKVKLKKHIKDQADLKHLEIAASEVKRLNDIVAKYLDYLKKSDKERAKVELKKLLG